MANMLGDNEALRPFLNGPLADLLLKLNETEGEEWLRALKRFLRKEPVYYENPAFSVWKEILLGRYQSLEKFDRALSKAQVVFGQNGNDTVAVWELFRQVSLSPKEKKIKVVQLEIKDLGLKKAYPLRSQVYRRALQLGFGLCPAEVGPQLCLQRKAHSMGRWVKIGMDPLRDLQGKKRTFEVANMAGTWVLLTNELMEQEDQDYLSNNDSMIFTMS